MALISFVAGVSLEARQTHRTHGARGARLPRSPQQTLFTGRAGDPVQPFGACLSRCSLGSHGTGLARWPLGARVSLGTLVPLTALAPHGSHRSPPAGGTWGTRLPGGAWWTQQAGVPAVTLLSSSSIQTRHTRVSRGPRIPRESNGTQLAFGSILSRWALLAGGSSSSRLPRVPLLPHISFGTGWSRLSWCSRISRFSRFPLFSHGTRLSHATRHSLRTLSTAGSLWSTGSWCTGGAHGAHISVLALLTRWARHSLQAWGAAQAEVTPRSLIPFLPKHSLLPAASRLPIGSRRPGVPDGSLDSGGSWGTHIALVPFAALLPGEPHLALIPIFSRGAGGAAWTRQSHGTLDPILPSRTHGTSLARGPLLANGTGGALGPPPAGHPDASSSSRGTALPGGACGSRGPRGSFPPLQARRTHGSGGPPCAGKAVDAGGAALPRNAAGTGITLGSLSAGGSGQPLLAGGAGGAGVSPLPHGSRLS